jgi:hypothetical protein
LGFIGTGQYSFNYLFNGLYTLNAVPTGGNEQSRNTTGLFGNVSVTYNYHQNPVPIPAAAWLLGTGLIGLVAIRRRKN